jgi:hypothetical protein
MYMTLSLSLFFIFIIVVICTILYDNEDTVTIMTERKLVPNVDAHTGIEIEPDEKGILTVDYHGVQRKVYNPLIVASGALEYYRDYVKETYFLVFYGRIFMNYY